MSKHLNVLVLCANGAATSTIALASLKEAFEDNNLSASFTQKRVVEGAEALKNSHFDVVISTAGMDFAEGTTVPILSGVPFLTGIGKDEVIKQIIEIANT